MKKKLKIPNFRTIQEEADFWDTHSFADYWDQMEDVQIEFINDTEKEELVTIRMNSKLKDQLRMVSRNQGLSVSSLARMWFIEKLRQA